MLEILGIDNVASSKEELIYRFLYCRIKQQFKLN